MQKSEGGLEYIENREAQFDVLKSHFFIDEVILSSVKISSIINILLIYFLFFILYNYLDGDIYNNACYFNIIFQQQMKSKIFLLI